MADARRYVVTVLTVPAALAAAAMAFNARVDPYALEAAQTGATETTERRAGALYRKVVESRHAHARTVILGTSRAQSGLPIDHPAFGERQKPVINLALGAATIEQIHLLLIHAHTISPLDTAIIGLDLGAFLEDGRSDFDPSLLAGNADSQPMPLSWLRTNVSLATLLASMRQRWGFLDDAQFDAGDAPVAGSGPDAANESQRIAVWTTEFRNFHGQLPLLFPPPGSHSDWSGDAKHRAAIAAFGQLLRYARRENIRLRLFISPVHARYLDWYRRVGWWPLFEGWKRALVAEMDREAEEHPNQESFVLWDMSGFRGPAAEPVPRLADTTSRMQWYLETSHYNDKLGARILDRMLGTAGIDDDWPVARIDARTVDTHLRRLYADAEDWRARNPGETANVGAMVAYLRRQSRR